MIWIIVITTLLTVTIAIIVITVIRAKSKDAKNQYIEPDNNPQETIEPPERRCAVCDYARYYFDDPIDCTIYSEKVNPNFVCAYFSREKMDRWIELILK